MNSTILKIWMRMVTSQHVLVNHLTNFLIPIQMRKLQELQTMVRVLCVNAVCANNASVKHT